MLFFTPMNRRALSVLLVSLWATVLSASALEIVHVWPGFRTAESFESIGEFFGHEEHRGGRLLLRSQPVERSGFYFLTRLKSPEAIADAEIRLDVILPGSPTPKTYLYATDLPAGASVLQVGVTGADWPDAKIRPLAWRLQVVERSTRRPLAETQSFLWSSR